MISSKNLILDAISRKEKAEMKKTKVMTFLRQHEWSTQDILQLVMGLESRQATHKSLSQLAKKGLIKKHAYPALGGNLTLWGITSHGQAMAFDIQNEMPFNNYFEPSKISEVLIRHQLDLQRIRVYAERQNWSKWTDGDRLGKLDAQTKRPDAIAYNPSGQKIAIECERTFKTTKRYEQILLSYLRLLKGQKIHAVVWVSPTDEMALRLQKIITSIRTLTYAGQKLTIDPNKHHTRLFFCSYAQWPLYEVS